VVFDPDLRILVKSLRALRALRAARAARKKIIAVDALILGVSSRKQGSSKSS